MAAEAREAVPPLDVMRKILPSERARCFSTLCALALVSKACNAAALEPQRWAELLEDINNGRWRTVTDKQLRTTMHRACAVVPGGARFLPRELDVTKTFILTLRGVLAALETPREGQQLLLAGKLRRLRVAGVRSDAADAGSAALLAALQGFLCADGGSLDVRTIAPCHSVRRSGDVCGRLARKWADACEACGLVVCDSCFAAKTFEACEHRCSKCLGDGYGGHFVECSKERCLHSPQKASPHSSHCAYSPTLAQSKHAKVSQPRQTLTRRA